MHVCYRNSRWNMDGSEKRRLVLLRLMQEKNMGNNDLARATGIHEVSISRYVTGAVRLNEVKTLEKLADGLGEHVCVFFDSLADGGPGIRDAVSKAVEVITADPVRGSDLIHTIEQHHAALKPAPQQNDEVKELRKDIEELKKLLIEKRKPSSNFTKAAAQKTTK